MSYCKEELREILSFSSALVINIGTMESKMCEMVIEAGKLAKELAIELESVIAITGKEDIVSDGKRVCKIKNGTPLLRKVTGTGCMTASLIGTICGAYREDIYEGAILGVVLMGIAGEIAEKSLTSEEGSGTFRMRIIDNIFNMTEEKIRENIKINFEN